MIKTNDQPEDSTRDRLLDAALTCFAESGYKGTTTRAICERAGVNLALLSYHWGGKRPLFEAVVRSFNDQLLRIAAEGAACSADQHDLGAGVTSFLEVVTERLFADPRGLRVMVWAQLAPDGIDPDVVHRAYEPAITAGSGFLLEAQRQGAIPASVDVPMTLVTFYGLLAEPILEPGVHRRLFHTDHTDPAHAARLQRHLVRSGLALLGLETP